jgi:hypothetical protein
MPKQVFATRQQDPASPDLLQPPTAAAVVNALAEDQGSAALGSAAGMIDLYNGNERQVGIDACLPIGIGAEGLEFIELRVRIGGLITSTDAQVQPGGVADSLAPAEQAGVKIVREPGIAQ